MRIITPCLGILLALLLFGCGEEEAPTPEAPAEGGESASAQQPPETPEPAQEAKAGAESTAPSQENPASTEGAAVENELSPDVPTEEECKAALNSMSEFAERIGIKPPKKRERKDFMMQCAGWPKSAVSCLAGANESQDVLNCMKPISEMEMKREIKEAKKTLPGRKRRGGGAAGLVPKEVKGTGGAAARRMKSFKKAVGKE